MSHLSKANRVDYYHSLLICLNISLLNSYIAKIDPQLSSLSN